MTEEESFDRVSSDEAEKLLESFNEFVQFGKIKKKDSKAIEALDKILGSVTDFVAKNPLELFLYSGIGYVSYKEMKWMFPRDVDHHRLARALWGMIGLKLATTPTYAEGAELGFWGVSIPINSQTVGISMLSLMGLSAIDGFMRRGPAFEDQVVNDFKTRCKEAGVPPPVLEFKEALVRPERVPILMTCPEADFQRMFEYEHLDWHINDYIKHYTNSHPELVVPEEER